MSMMHDILDDSVSRVMLIVTVMILPVLLLSLATVELLCDIFKILFDFWHVLKQFP